MVQIREFRITMPFSLDEYRVGLTYMRTRFQRENTKGSEGVQVLASEPFSNSELGSGHFSHTVYHFDNRAPAWIRALAPSGSLALVEKNWNSFPRCRTEITCPYFTHFKIVTDSVFVADKGETENALNLSASDLSIRRVEQVDIANMGERDMWSRIITRKPTDVTKIACSKLKRGPLQAGWQDAPGPVMTCYKLVRVEARYWAIGRQMELGTITAQRALYVEANRKLYGWADDWCEMTVADVRRIEKENNDAMRRSLVLSSREGSAHFDEAALAEQVAEMEAVEEEAMGYASSAPVRSAMAVTA